MQGLLSVRQISQHSVEEIVSKGEGRNVEFKAVFSPPVMQTAVAKGVAGLLNSDGGVLLIGVTDKGEIIGIGEDAARLGKPNLDGYENHLTNRLVGAIGASALAHVTVSLQQVNDRAVCRVDVRPSPEPVYSTEDGEQKFFARFGNSTRPLSIQEIHAYVKARWA
jgi:ATP-dependent Lon protease